MKLSYFPGCTLKTKARDLDLSTISAMEALGIELEELPRWNCCGTVFSFADDDLIHQIAPVRNLIRAQEQGANKLVTVCSFCFNTLKRANLLVKENSDKLDTLNTFMDEEDDYKGNIDVVHLLEVLRDDVGWEQIAGKVRNPLNDLKIAAYYGCTLHRPKEAAIEPPYKPKALNDLIKAVGATPIDFPDMTTCCGSYQAVANPDIVISRTKEIIASARKSGAEIIAVSCPLCECNLRENQKEPDELRMPVIYFTQLLALALGVDSHLHQDNYNAEAARLLLESKGFPVA